MTETITTFGEAIDKIIKSKVKTPINEIRANKQGWARVELKNKSFALFNVVKGTFATEFTDISEFAEDASFTYATRNDGKQTLINLKTGTEITYNLVKRNKEDKYVEDCRYEISCVHEANQNGWAVVDLTGRAGFGFINVKTGETSGNFKFAPQNKISLEGLVLVSDKNLNTIYVYDINEESLCTDKDKKPLSYGPAIAINDQGWVTSQEKNGNNITTRFFNLHTGKAVQMSHLLPEVGILSNDDMLPIKLKKGWTLIDINDLVDVEAKDLAQAIEDKALTAKFKSKDAISVMAAYAQNTENVGKLSQFAQTRYFKEMVGYIKSQNTNSLTRTDNAINALTKTLITLRDIQDKIKEENNSSKKPSKKKLNKEKMSCLNAMYNPKEEKDLNNDPKPKANSKEELKNKSKSRADSKKEKAAKRKEELNKIMALLSQLDSTPENIDEN